MNDEYGTPIPPIEEAQGGNDNRKWIIIIVVLVVLCCCCLVTSGIVWGLWTYGDEIFNLYNPQIMHLFA